MCRLLYLGQNKRSIGGKIKPKYSLHSSIWTFRQHRFSCHHRQCVLGSTNCLDHGSAICGSRATCGFLNPQLWLLLEVNKDLFLGIIFGITEVFEPDGSFAAPAGLRIVTNGLIWLFKCKRLPIPGLDS